MNLKPIDEQVIVIIGATTPLGKRLIKTLTILGAKVVMSSADEHELQRVLDKSEKKDKHVLAVVADTSTVFGIREVKDAALAVYKRIDAWINVEREMVEEDFIDADFDEEKERFDQIFWSSRYGSEAAISAMEKSGGIIINLGHEDTAQTRPLLGMFKAAKLATKSFTDALRVQVRDRNIPVEICFIRPTSDMEENVNAILKCLEHPKREIVVGGAVRMTAIIETFFPKVNELLMENHMKEKKSNKRMFYVKEQ